MNRSIKLFFIGFFSVLILGSIGVFLISSNTEIPSGPVTQTEMRYAQDVDANQLTPSN